MSKIVQPQIKETIISITCDCCHKTTTDPFEIQEYMSHSDIGGYGNHAFGDGTNWSIDLCQDCIKLLLGPYIRFNSKDW